MYGGQFPGEICPEYPGELEERVHQFGGLLTPAEVVQNACGSFDPTVYTDYLANKYSQLYGLG